MLKRVTDQLKPNRLFPVVVASLLIFAFLAVSFSYTVVREFYYFAQQEHQNYAQKYAANLAATERLADTIYESVILQPHILELVQEAVQNEGSHTSRQALYEALLPTYNALRKAEIQQLHFHTPDNYSLLRFHRPGLYGDNLNQIRASVERVNTTKQPFHGFEEGRIFNGYRHIYPLMIGDEHIGSVEISSSLLNFKRTYERNGADSVDFVLYADIVQAALFAEDQDQYEPHPLHSNLVIQRELNDYARVEGIFEFPEKQEILRQLSERSAVSDAVTQSTPYFGVILKDWQIYSVQLTPILSDARARPAGFIVNLTRFRFLGESISRYAMQLMLFLLVSFVFALVLLRLRRVLAETQLLARVDNLTGLFNRLYFTVLIKQLLAENVKPSASALKRKKGKGWVARKYTLIMFDIDHFKHINDTYGHDVGDVALETIADSIRAAMPKGALHCRWGGEEFMALVRGSEAEGLAIAEKLREQIAVDAQGDPKLPNYTSSYTCSLGVVELTSLAQLEDALKAADEALYRAKANGRDRVEVSALPE